MHQKYFPARMAVILFVLVMASGARKAKAQNFDDPVVYMEYIGKTQHELMKKYLSYTSAVSHGKSARKVEKKRNELIESCWETRSKVNAMPFYKGDRALRDASVKYLEILYRVLNEDYSKIVNMEEIAEQSYDNMEAYLLAQEKADEKLQEAGEKSEGMQQQFADKNNIRLIQTESDLTKKMIQSGRVNHYYNEIYLIFFKSYKQEMYLTEAVNGKNINAIEQNKNALVRFANEGLAVLDTIKNFDGDPSLINSCKKMLQFYQKEASEGIPVVTDFFMKNETFTQIKKEMDKKSSGSLTQAEVDKYNGMVKDFNAAVNGYNNTQKQLNSNRSTFLNDWNNAVKQFMDRHMPYYN